MRVAAKLRMQIIVVSKMVRSRERAGDERGERPARKTGRSEQQRLEADAGWRPDRSRRSKLRAQPRTRREEPIVQHEHRGTRGNGHCGCGLVEALVFAEAMRDRSEERR